MRHAVFTAVSAATSCHHTLSLRHWLYSLCSTCLSHDLFDNCVLVPLNALHPNLCTSGSLIMRRKKKSKTNLIRQSKDKIIRILSGRKANLVRSGDGPSVKGGAQKCMCHGPIAIPSPPASEAAWFVVLFYHFRWGGRYISSQSTYLGHLVFLLPPPPILTFRMPRILNWGDFTPSSPLQGHLAMSRHILVIMTGGGVHATDTQEVEVSVAANRPTMDREASSLSPPAKNYLVRNVSWGDLLYAN